MESCNVWKMFSIINIWSIRVMAWENGTLFDFQFRAIAHCIATWMVCLRFNRCLGKSGIFLNKKQCTVEERRLLTGVSTRVNTSFQVGCNITIPEYIFFLFFFLSFLLPFFSPLSVFGFVLYCSSLFYLSVSCSVLLCIVVVMFCLILFFFSYVWKCTLDQLD